MTTSNRSRAEKICKYRLDWSCAAEEAESGRGWTLDLGRLQWPNDFEDTDVSSEEKSHSREEGA